MFELIEVNVEGDYLRMVSYHVSQTIRGGDVMACRVNELASSMPWIGAGTAPRIANHRFDV